MRSWRWKVRRCAAADTSAAQQRPHQTGQLIGGGDGGVRRRRTALQRLGAGPDAEAEAAEAAPAGLDQRSPGVGLAVATLVAVVVGEPVRQHDQQPPCDVPPPSSSSAPWRIAAPRRV